MAKILGISRIAVYKKVKKGQIKGARVGRNYIVHKSNINKKIDKRSYITIPQLAKELQVSRVCIHQRVKRGLIPAEKLGRNFLIPKDYTKEAREEAKLVSIPELAKEAGLSRVAVFKQVKAGKIKAERRGKKFVIEKGEARKCVKALRKKRTK